MNEKFSTVYRTLKSTTLLFNFAVISDVPYMSNFVMPQNRVQMERMYSYIRF